MFSTGRHKNADESPRKGPDVSGRAGMELLDPLGSRGGQWLSLPGNDGFAEDVKDNQALIPRVNWVKITNKTLGAAAWAKGEQEMQQGRTRGGKKIFHAKGKKKKGVCGLCFV